jgi:lysophospholipase L1-like esterase
LRPTLNNLFKNVAALVIGLAFALGLLEGGARAMANVLGVSPYMEYDATIGWKATPNTEKRHKSSNPPFDVVYRINAHGLRGPYYPIAKPAQTRRIVLLGDSVGFGWGVPEGKQFAALLDEGLEATEVINLSLSGYGTEQQLLRLKNDGLPFKPDLVILQVTPNDFDEIQFAFFNQKPKPQFVFDDAGALRLTNVPVTANSPQAQEFYRYSIPVPFREWVGWHSYAYNWLNEKYYGIRRRSAPSRPPTPRFSSHSIALFNGIVAEIKATVDREGIDLLIVHAAAEVAAQRPFAIPGIPVVDASEKFAEYQKVHGEPAMFSDGFHWNERGNAIAAQEVMNALRLR